MLQGSAEHLISLCPYQQNQLPSGAVPSLLTVLKKSTVGIYFPDGGEKNTKLCKHQICEFHIQWITKNYILMKNDGSLLTFLYKRTHK
jgi:hypothetical protein